MRCRLAVCSVLSVALAAGFSGLVPLTKASAQTAGAAENRYFMNLGDILGDLPVDAFIKETVKDGKVTSTVLDACYSVSLTSNRKDRFVVDLNGDGQKLTGTGTTMESKSPVTVTLMRKGTKGAVTFDGKILIGDKPSLVSSTDNSASDQREFEATQSIDEGLTENPKDFTEVAPQSLAVRVKRENLVELINSLRLENVQLTLDSLATDCTALRTGLQLVRLTVDPARAQALLSKLKSSPGVVSAGWTTGDYDIERAIRIPAADWRDGDKLDKDKLTKAISEGVAKEFSAQPVSAKWDDTTGELTVKVKRPNTSAPELNLTDTIEVSAMVGPEKPGASDNLIVWFGTTSTTTSDETKGPHLSFSDDPSGDESDSSFTDDDSLIRALATDLNGQPWDSGEAKWRQ